MSDLVSQVNSTSLALIAGALCLGFVVGLAAIVHRRKAANRRLDMLSRDIAQVTNDRDFGLRVPVRGSKKMSHVAINVNGLLATMQRSRQESLQENDKLRKNIKALRTLAEIDREITAKSESKSILQLVCRRTPDLLDLPKAAVILKEKPGRAFASHGLRAPDKFSAARGDFFNATSAAGTPYGHNIYGFTGGAIEGLLSAECRQLEDIQAAAVALLTVENEILGLLLCFDTVARAWSGDDIQFLSLVAAQATLALDAARLIEKEASRQEELASLYNLSRGLANANPDTDSMLSLITRNAVEKVHVTFARAALREDGNYVVRAANPIRIFDRELDAPIRAGATIDLLNSAVSSNKTQIIQYDNVAPDVKHELMLDSISMVCLVPIRTDKGTVGVLMLGEERSPEREPFTEEKLRLASNIGDQAVSALRRAELFEELASAYLETVMALANAVDVKDTYTGDHGRRLADMAMAIGQELGMTQRQLRDLYYGAILHDIGKIGIPDFILLKSARLNDEEWKYMKQHPALGEQILAPVSYLSGAAAIVRHHHERFGGDGYPDGLAGKDIPLGARILTVVDSFCAIMDKRTYKEACSVEEATAELQRCSGTQFDPEVVNLFVKMLRQGVFDLSVEEETRPPEEGSAAAA